MKVGIFTFPNSTSYGAVLQMYALYRAVASLGHTPEVINYQNAYMKANKHTSRKSWLRQKIGYLLHWRLYHKFQQFESKNMERFPNVLLSDSRQLPAIAKRYGAVICGSDQVWNPDITGGDLSYFLDFCDEETRRVAYAPSFGLSEFSEDFSNKIRADLAKFHALSVREAPGQALIAELTGETVPLVCDPTLLLQADEWVRMEKAHPAARDAYILYYTIRRSAKLWSRCKELAMNTGLKIVVVGGNPLKIRNDKYHQIEYAVDISPEEWLYLLHHAQYVVTNSFHGTAFSVNYRKNFYVEFSSLTNSRLEQITQTLGLTDRVVREGPLSGAETDYTIADQVIPKMRRNSLSYLKDALE